MCIIYEMPLVSVRPSVCPSVPPFFMYPSVFTFVRSSVCPCARPSFRAPIRLSGYLFLRPSVRLSLCPPFFPCTDTRFACSMPNTYINSTYKILKNLIAGKYKMTISSTKQKQWQCVGTTYRGSKL